MAPAASRPAPASAAAPLDVELRAAPAGGAFTPVLVQRAAAPLKLASALTLERRGAAGTFEAVSDAQLALRFDCATPVAPCIELVPGAELHAPAWPARLGDAQCGCEACAAAPAGEYRLRVRSCDGAAQAHSPAFRVP